MSVRDERLMMADKRALAKQSERMNPVEPLKNTTRKGRTTLVNSGAEYTGKGATPSTGLSQVRGGRTRRQRSPSPAEDGMSGGAIVGGAMLGQTRKVGAGTKKGEMRLTARKAYEPDAHSMGAALGTHLKQLHGSGFYEDFRKGMELGEVADDEMEGGIKTGRYEGKGKLVIQHLPHGEGEELHMGKGSHDRVRDEEQKGCGKKSRKPAGPNDARRKRGAMVSKLMKEQGMSLAEASRHIKQHGLV